MSRYKYCIVPQCRSTTFRTPDKLFFSIPIGEMRKKWCLVIGRVSGVHRTLSPRCNRFVCEDHFNLEDDMENYMMWRSVGVRKLRLKKGVLPHKFDCQTLPHDVQKNCTMIDQEKRMDNDMYHSVNITEIKDEYVKDIKGGRFCMCKTKDRETQHNIEVEIKQEVSECVSLSEEETNIVFKNEVDEIETYIFNLNYDRDTGKQYLTYQKVK